MRRNVELPIGDPFLGLSVQVLRLARTVGLTFVGDTGRCQVPCPRLERRGLTKWVNRWSTPLEERKRQGVRGDGCGPQGPDTPCQKIPYCQVLSSGSRLHHSRGKAFDPGRGAGQPGSGRKARPGTKQVRLSHCVSAGKELLRGPLADWLRL